jgi:hypothetical protein
VAAWLLAHHDFYGWVAVAVAVVIFKPGLVESIRVIVINKGVAVIIDTIAVF